MRWPKFLLPVLALLGCVPKFVDTTTPGGVPNLFQYAPKMWRMGQPPTDAAWTELSWLISPNHEQVTVVKLDDETEGSDDYAETALGWEVIHVPMPPEDDKNWTVLVKPNPGQVRLAVNSIITAHAAGKVVVHHCVHGRDRTSLITALVGMKLFGWTKEYAWNNMLQHGFRWELPDLDAYWIEDVK